MHCLLLLLALQSPQDSAYSSEALRDIVARAAARSGERHRGIQLFSARFESSIAIVRTLPERVEGASSVEQVAGSYRARTGGYFSQHREGYRVITTGIPLLGGALLRQGWIAPPLDGNWVNLLLPSRAIDPGLTPPDTTGEVIDSTPHPLSPLRDRFYRYRGGDTLWTTTPDGARLRLIRVKVWPRVRQPGRARLFRGELYLDPVTADLRRVRGELINVGGPPPGLWPRLRGAAVPSAHLVDFVFTEVEGAGMVPTWQWLELRVQVPFEVDGFTILRVTTRLLEPTVTTSAALLRPTGVTSAPNDSLRRYADWRAPATRDPSAVNYRLLADVGPPRTRPLGPPVLLFRGSSSADFLRYNRVEGLYTGALGTLQLRSLAPGLSLRGGVGRAWASDITRPSALLRWEGEKWFAEAQGARALELVTKFPGPLERGFGLRALIGKDNFDYVDRRMAGAAVGRYLRADHAGLITGDFAFVEDRLTPAVISSSAIGQQLDPNPGIDAGRYRRTRLRLDLNPRITPRFTAPGLALRLSYERGDGDLRYDRYQAEFVARGNWRWILVTLVGDAGIVRGDSIPPQQLFLLGGQGTLPGYTYDRFAGDRAALLRALVNIPLAFGATPVHVSGNFSLPPLAPTISFRLYTGWTDAPSRASQASIGRLGTRPGASGTTIPFAETSGRLRATSEVRLILLGGLVGVGMARPLEAGHAWKFQFSIGQTF